MAWPSARRRRRRRQACLNPTGRTSTEASADRQIPFDGLVFVFIRLSVRRGARVCANRLFTPPRRMLAPRRGQREGKNLFFAFPASFPFCVFGGPSLLFCDGDAWYPRGREHVCLSNRAIMGKTVCDRGRRGNEEKKTPPPPRTAASKQDVQRCVRSKNYSSLSGIRTRAFTWHQVHARRQRGGACNSSSYDCFFSPPRGIEAGG